MTANMVTDRSRRNPERESGDSKRKHGDNGRENISSGSPQQFVIDRNRCGGKSGKDQQPANKTVSGCEQRRQLLPFAAVRGQMLGHQQRRSGNCRQNVSRQFRLRCAEEHDRHKHPDEKK
jgi:hypothetical protein